MNVATKASNPTAPFPMSELSSRVERARLALSQNDLDGILISVPESIYWLTGMDHWGFLLRMS